MSCSIGSLRLRTGNQERRAGGRRRRFSNPASSPQCISAAGGAARQLFDRAGLLASIDDEDGPSRPCTILSARSIIGVQVRVRRGSEA